MVINVKTNELIPWGVYDQESGPATFLAPMVRAGSLAFRILCLEMGADVVYGPEIIAHKMKYCISRKRITKVIGYDDEIEIIDFFEGVPYGGEPYKRADSRLEITKRCPSLIPESKSISTDNKIYDNIDTPDSGVSISCNLETHEQLLKSTENVLQEQNKQNDHEEQQDSTTEALHIERRASNKREEAAIEASIRKGHLPFFSTCALEAGRNVFQIGVRDSDLARTAVYHVHSYVGAFDVNMGCPKKFSTSGAMGARLLEDPEAATSVLSALRDCCPENQPVTCKVRFLGDKEITQDESIKRTAEFIGKCHKAGAYAVAIHMRLTHEMSYKSFPARWGWLEKLYPMITDHSLIINGDFLGEKELNDFSSEYFKPTKMMMGRGALAAPIDVFGGNSNMSWDKTWRESLPTKLNVDRPKTTSEVIARFLDIAESIGEVLPTAKYTTQYLLHGVKGQYLGVSLAEVQRDISKQKTYDALRKLLINPSEVIRGIKQISTDELRSIINTENKEFSSAVTVE